MIKCFAVDDEPLALEIIEDFAGKAPFPMQLKTFENATLALRQLQTEAVDLLFLDIKMPDITGLQFIKALKKPPMVILTTAYQEYAIEGFNLDVVDYLLKPIPFERFLKACNKAYDLLYAHNRQPEPANTGRDYFFVNVEYKQVKLNFTEITYIEAMKDYVKIHLTHGKPILTRLSMKGVEEKLFPGMFARIHKSYIVSVPKIEAIKRGLVLMGPHEIPLSDNYKSNLGQLLGIQPE